MAGRTGMLLAVLAVALLHPLFQARVRPLYQVSDEMAYLRTAQLEALATSPPAARPCIAPPDGVPLEAGEGGKRGYAALTGLQLRRLCAGEREGMPLFALRALQALSLPLVALAAWYLARLVSGSHGAGLLAALVVAVHPVAAKYAGGVTPDAWANAFSAGVVVGLTRITVGRQRWWDVWLVAACAFAGMLWKDTAHMLVPLAALALVLALVQAAALRQPGLTARWRLPASICVGLIVVSAVVIWSRDDLLTRYVQEIPDGRVAIVRQPLRFATEVLQDVLLHMGGILASSVQSLYRPVVYGPGAGAGQPVTPLGTTMILVVLGVAGAVGALLHWVRPHRGMHRLPTRVLGVWALVLALAFVQPSIRQVLLDLNGLHQGRWLFPALAPAAALVAIGLARLGERRGAIPLIALACLTSLWIAVLDLVRHYYTAFPHQLVRSALFTRPTGEIDIGDAAVVRLIEDVIRTQSPWGTWSILVLLVVASLAVAMSVIRHARSPAPHV